MLDLKLGLLSDSLMGRACLECLHGVLRIRDSPEKFLLGREAINYIISQMCSE